MIRRLIRPLQRGRMASSRLGATERRSAECVRGTRGSHRYRICRCRREQAAIIGEGRVSQDGRLDSDTAKPVCFLEVPPGIRIDVKRKLVKRISAAIAEAYQLPDVLVFFREYPSTWSARMAASNRRIRWFSKP
jgi:hypothetical protein